MVNGFAYSVVNDDDHRWATLRPWFDPWPALLDANPGLRVVCPSNALDARLITRSGSNGFPIPNLFA